jgi:hypothetical protein
VLPDSIKNENSKQEVRAEYTIDDWNQDNNTSQSGDPPTINKGKICEISIDPIESISDASFNLTRNQDEDPDVSNGDLEHHQDQAVLDQKNENETEDMDEVEEVAVEELRKQFGGWIPKLMQSDDPQNRAFLDKKGQLHYMCIDHELATEDVSNAVIYAYQYSLLMGCANRKSMKRVLHKHTEMPFTICDWDTAMKTFGNTMDIFHIQKKRSKLNSPHDYKPGELILIDPKQAGGKAGKESKNILHAIDHATHFQWAIPYHHSSSYSKQGAIEELLKRVRQTMAMSKRKDIRPTRYIYCDADRGFDETVKAAILRKHNVIMGPAQANYSCAKVEAAIKQTDIRLAKLAIYDSRLVEF